MRIIRGDAHSFAEPRRRSSQAEHVGSHITNHCLSAEPLFCEIHLFLTTALGDRERERREKCLRHVAEVTQ